MSVGPAQYNAWCDDVIRRDDAQGDEHYYSIKMAYTVLVHGLMHDGGSWEAEVNAVFYHVLGHFC